MCHAGMPFNEELNSKKNKNNSELLNPHGDFLEQDSLSGGSVDFKSCWQELCWGAGPGGRTLNKTDTLDFTHHLKVTLLENKQTRKKQNQKNTTKQTKHRASKLLNAF